MQRLKDLITQHELATQSAKWAKEALQEVVDGVGFNHFSVETDDSIFKFEFIDAPGAAIAALNTVRKYYETVAEHTAARLAKAEGALDD